MALRVVSQTAACCQFPVKHTRRITNTDQISVKIITISDTHFDSFGLKYFQQFVSGLVFLLTCFVSDIFRL